jgi:hypothetical protein
MVHVRHITGLGVAFLVLAPWLGAPSARALPGEQAQGPIIAPNPAPTPEQIRSLTARLVENQRRNDLAIEEYERLEHSISHKSENPEIIVDLTERRVPSPAGDIKLKTLENGVPVSPDQYRQELEFAVNALQTAAHPDDRYRDGVAKYQKRLHDRAELMDEAARAFRVTWAGRETRADSTGAHEPRTLMKFFLDPDPAFKPTNRLAVTFQHIHGTIWVDEAAAQFARLEADIVTDITFVGGIAGKVNHGGHVEMEQSEVAPGVWLPTLFSFNIDGRKFLFAFGVHERSEISQYRRVGAPAQALEIMRNELSTLSAASPAR